MSIAPLSLNTMLAGAVPAVPDGHTPSDDLGGSSLQLAHRTTTQGTEDFGALSTVTEPLLQVPFDLSDVSHRELRRWSNRLLKALDSDFPPYGTSEDYERVVDELRQREDEARSEPTGTSTREKFRDNPMNRRFELFRNGMLAGYVAYTMRGGTLRLHRTIVADTFDGAGIEKVLIQNVLLAAHKRRLATIPYCHQAQAFLDAHPHFRALITTA